MFWYIWMVDVKYEAVTVVSGSVTCNTSSATILKHIFGNFCVDSCYEQIFWDNKIFMLQNCLCELHST